MASEDIREKVLTEAMKELKEKAGLVIGEIMSNLYTDYLPHVFEDTESNISYRVEGCIKNMIAGRYKESDNGSPMVWVDDCYGNQHLINFASYGLTLKPLCDLVGETIHSERIKQLESEVDSLNRSLQDAYRR